LWAAGKGGFWGFVAFFEGILEKRMFLGGIFVVSCGELRGKSWLVDG
jgi:hypothetical protein